jgi:urease accessory protein
MRVGRTVVATAVAVSALGCSVASAHTGHGEAGDLAHGLAHPFGGLDHILAMVAVGILAVQHGGRALLALPAAFLAATLGGALLTATGIRLPLLEPGILASVLVVGLLLVVPFRLPLGAAVALIAGFAVFHGYAHLMEAPTVSGSAGYAAGVLLGTALLHAGGIALGLSARWWFGAVSLRGAGVGIVLAGLAFAAGI